MYKRAFAPIALLLLAVPAGMAAQSAVPASEPAVAPEPSKLLDRVLVNQKKEEAALEVYERIEQLETRKGANDPAPASIKIRSEEHTSELQSHSDLVCRLLLEKKKKKKKKIRK